MSGGSQFWAGSERRRPRAIKNTSDLVPSATCTEAASTSSGRNGIRGQSCRAPNNHGPSG
eukprot:7842887-Pyramimonas_sp.AAC.1